MWRPRKCYANELKKNPKNNTCFRLLCFVYHTTFHLDGHSSYDISFNCHVYLMKVVLLSNRLVWIVIDIPYIYINDYLRFIAKKKKKTSHVSLQCGNTNLFKKYATAHFLTIKSWKKERICTTGVTLCNCIIMITEPDSTVMTVDNYKKKAFQILFLPNICPTDHKCTYENNFKPFLKNTHRFFSLFLFNSLKSLIFSIFSDIDIIF